MRVSFWVLFQYGFHFGFYFNTGCILGFYVHAGSVSGSMLQRVLFWLLWRRGFSFRLYFDTNFISGFISDTGFISVHTPLLFYFGSYTTSVFFVLTPITIESFISQAQLWLRIGLKTFTIVLMDQILGSILFNHLPP